MPWVRAKLRGQVVFARATTNGDLAAEGGRVEIRYNKNDGRLYRAGASNLELVDGEILPDETCGEADEVTRADKGKATAKKKSSKGRKRTASVANPPTEAPKDGVIAYTDGACSGNPGPAGLGVVVLSETERIERYEARRQAEDWAGMLDELVGGAGDQPASVSSGRSSAAR